MSSADPGSDGETGPTGSALRRRLLSWKGVTLEVLFALAALATVLTYVLPTGTPVADPPRPSDPPSATSSSPAAATPTASRTPERAAVLPVGTCLPAGLHQSTRCDAAHAWEVVSTGECTQAALIQYLGGRPDLEIVRAQPQRKPLATGSSACVVRDPTSDNPLTSARGVLAGPDRGSGWRLCRDERTAADVACSVPHTGEYVLTSSTAPVDCEQAAATYLNAPLSRFTTKLQVVRLQQSTGPQCVVVAQGADLLSATVRNIGVSALPTSR